MIQIYILCSLIAVIVILIIGLNIKISDIKKVKSIGYNEVLKIITDKLPNNVDVCKNMLKIINNNNVIIEEEKDNKSNISLYLVIFNKIIIANIKNTFTRIQTIAHECVHSIQNKKILMFNFIFSNIYILYYITILILTIFNIIQNKDILNIFLIIYILMSIIYYVIRSYLEIDAMIRARYLSEEYLENISDLNDNEKYIILSKYDELNKIGIKLYIFALISKSIIQAMIYDLILILKW